MTISRRAFFSTCLFTPLCVACGASNATNVAPAQSAEAPASRFDLSSWKLQIPGPKDITDLASYTSKYFYLDTAQQMAFWVDCTDTAHTANSDYVRSELRHMSNWSVNDSDAKTLAATLSVNSHADPDKVTVLQIHGATDNGDNAPPLLRIALNNGTLYAFLKTDNSGDNTDGVVLAPHIGSGSFSCALKVQKGQLSINVNGTEQLKRDISFWQYANYFKAGCYPQAHLGTVITTFSALSVQAAGAQP